MKKLFLILFVFVSGAFVFCFPQTKLNFDIDYSQFAFDADSNMVEFYYLFETSSMQKVQEDSSRFVDGVLTISVKDTVTGNVIISREWEFRDSSNELIRNNKNLVGVLRFVIPEGIYSCKFTGSNKYDSSSMVTYNEILRIEPLIKDKISLSGVELANKIIPQSENINSLFYKNTYEVIPSPNVLFGDNQPAMFYYLEIYNLNQLEKKSPLMLMTQIYNTKGKQFHSKIMPLVHNQDSRVLVGSVNVNSYPTDSYTLILSAIDSINHYAVTSSKKFYVYNSKIMNTDTAIVSELSSIYSEFFSLSEEELDAVFEKSKYIASTSEINQFENLSDADAKREFLHNFWSKRDTDPSTPRNEYFEKYFKRIEYANKNFNSIKTPGWKTDRGRVYIEYGAPSEIDRYPSSQNSKPYEIWTYNDIEGGVEFVFGDLIGLSNYQLLHSTKRGEVNDPNWENRLRAL